MQLHNEGKTHILIKEDVFWGSMGKWDPSMNTLHNLIATYLRISLGFLELRKLNSLFS